MSNVGADGKPVDRSDRKIVGNMANQLWHSDSSFQKPAAKYSLLLAVRLPSWGGETEFCDLRAAYDGLEPVAAVLPASRRRLARTDAHPRRS